MRTSADVRFVRRSPHVRMAAAVRRGMRRVEAGLAGYGSSVYDIGG